VRASGSSLHAGRASLAVELVSGASAVTSACATNPLKLLTPRSRGDSVWAYTSSFGGGLVAGDEVRLELDIEAGARCFLGTQSSTKVYRNPAQRPCSQQLNARIGPDGLLAFVPDPVQCFAGASYSQRQAFRLAPDASLVLVDWVSGGRTARGERWAFSHYATRSEIWCRRERDETAHPEQNGSPLGESDELAFLDSVCLSGEDQPLPVGARLGRFNCIGMLVLFGPLVRDAAKSLLEHVAAQPVSRRAALAFSSSPLADGALLRLAGEQVEDVGRELHRRLAFLSVLLGDDPWARKW
jgi:urease accessory protein